MFEINSLDIEKAGKNVKILIGDINGDGRMELVCAQPNGGIDDRYVPHQVVCLTAYALTGEMLWQVGSPSAEPGGPGSDYPCQIADIDGDGKLEVLVVMDKTVLVLEGETGAVKKSFELKNLPNIDSEGKYLAGQWENAHDCIIVANLRGLKSASDIILKDRYFNMWALDGDFNVLWTHSGNLGHFPLVYDINGDGFDEVMAGYDMLNCKGELMWSCKDLDDHADCLWIGDVNGDGKPEICVGGSVTCLYDVDGNELWRYDGSVESQHVALGHFIPDSTGLQVAGLDRIRRGDGYKGQWDGKDGMFLLDSDGKELWKEDRKTPGWLTIVNTYRNWNGEGKDYILAYRRGGGVNPTLYNHLMEEVVTFPTDGYVGHADLFGRNCEDMIIYAEGVCHIYSGKEYDLNQAPSGKQLYQNAFLTRSTLYPGCVYETHTRRVRYKGTHPRNYSEKYKEHDPSKYQETIEKVISKGMTPAGMHISICVEEILDFLQIKPGQIGFDATLGYGGHTRKMLEKLEGKGHMYATDVDPIESEKTKKRLAELGYGEDILTIKLMNFKDVDKIADEYGKFDFLLADLGVSSMQIDNPERGFTYKKEGPLDLRLDPLHGISAAERLKNITEDELYGMLVENSDEPYADEIATRIVREIKRGNAIETTTQLYEVIEKALVKVPEKDRKEAVKKSAARTFQALRIDVNKEFEVLYEFLNKLPDVMNPGGRIAILTFHSGEDKLVKQAFKHFRVEGQFSYVNDEVIRPSKEECIRNSRAHSTKMRVAIKA